MLTLTFKHRLAYAYRGEIEMMPLTMANIGESLEIKKISGRDDTKRFLASLGFVIGSQVTIISRFGDNFIINVKDTRVAIDQSMAKRILI